MKKEGNLTFSSKKSPTTHNALKNEIKPADKQNLHFSLIRSSIPFTENNIHVNEEFSESKLNGFILVGHHNRGHISPTHESSAFEKTRVSNEDFILKTNARKHKRNLSDKSSNHWNYNLVDKNVKNFQEKSRLEWGTELVSLRSNSNHIKSTSIGMNPSCIVSGKVEEEVLSKGPRVVGRRSSRQMQHFGSALRNLMGNRGAEIETSLSDQPFAPQFFRRKIKPLIVKFGGKPKKITRLSIDSSSPKPNPETKLSIPGLYCDKAENNLQLGSRKGYFDIPFQQEGLKQINYLSLKRTDKESLFRCKSKPKPSFSYLDSISPTVNLLKPTYNKNSEKNTFKLNTLKELQEIDSTNMAAFMDSKLVSEEVKNEILASKQHKLMGRRFPLKEIEIRNNVSPNIELEILKDLQALYITPTK